MSMCKLLPALWQGTPDCDQNRERGSSRKEARQGLGVVQKLAVCQKHGSMSLKFYAAAAIGLVTVGSLFLSGWRGVQEGGQGGSGIARVLRGVSGQVKHHKKSEVEQQNHNLFGI